MDWLPDVERQIWEKDGGSFTSGPAKLVMHTTETRGWPSYRNGATAPHITILATPMDKKLHLRQHIPLDVAARAMQNDSGGVQTNRDSARQVELVGTCDPVYARRYPDAFKWYDPPDWAIRQLAEYLYPICKTLDISFNIPKLSLPYPQSYGSKNGQRMTMNEWDSFNGICEHQHVPENFHGDAGAFPIAKLKLYLHELDTIDEVEMLITKYPDSTGIFLVLNDGGKIHLHSTTEVDSLKSQGVKEVNLTRATIDQMPWSECHRIV